MSFVLVAMPVSMFVIVLVGLAADKLLFAPAERFLRRRWGTGS